MWVGPCRPRGPRVSIANALGILVMGNPSIPPLPRDSPSRTGVEPNDSTIPRLQSGPLGWPGTKARGVRSRVSSSVCLI